MGTEVQEMKAKKIVLNTPIYKTSAMYSPMRAYRCSPGDVLDIRYPDGRSDKAIAVRPPDNSTVTHECHARRCIFSRPSGALCKLDTMFCFSKRPYVLFKPIDNVLEDI